MQDPAIFHPMKPQFPEQEQLKCPRCESTNTKFCYYNNYNLSQPRHFCKNCKRYWTKGGALRNIPVGGGSRKNTKKPSNQKRSSSSSSTFSVSSTSTTQVPYQQPGPTPKSAPSIDQGSRMFEFPGSFSSLLTSNGQFGNLMEGLNPNISCLKMLQMGELGKNENMISGVESKSESGRTPRLEVQLNNNSQNYLGMQIGDSSRWNGSNGWSDLAIYAPGSSYQ